MARTERRRLWPTLIAVPGVLLLIGLGTWQVDRLHWKEALIAQREQRTAAEPLELAAATGAPSTLEYRRVRARGHFLHEREMYWAARTLNGQYGYHIVTPLQPETGPPVLVDRGWVPADRRDPESRPGSQPAGPVLVEGHIRLGGRPNDFTPDNEPERNQWFYADPDAMARHAGLPPERPYYIQAAPGASPDSLPVAVELSVDLPNNHLQYALTWYALAVGLTVTYIVYMRRRRPD